MKLLNEYNKRPSKWSSFFFLIFPLLIFSQNDFFTNSCNIDFRTKYLDSQKTGAANIKGNGYLFEDWNNTVVVETIDDKSFTIKSVNYNVVSNKLEIKIQKDSILVLSPSAIKTFNINNRFFKKVENQSNHYEHIFSGDKIKFLRSFGYKIKEGAVDPMTMKKVSDDKIFVTEDYWIWKDGKIESIALKKKSILEMFGSEKKKTQQWAKSQNLSFKKEDDIKKILEYYESL